MKKQKDKEQGLRVLIDGEWLEASKELKDTVKSIDDGLKRDKELDKAMLTPEEILAAPSGETVYNDDGSMDIRASRLNREIEIAKAQLAKARKVIAEEERKRVGQTLQSMVDNAPPNHKLRQIENWTKYYLLGEQNLRERYQGERQ